MTLRYSTHGLPIIETKNGEFLLGAIRPDPVVKGSFQAYSSKYPIVPRAQWREVDYRFYKSPTWNQGRHGSCAGHASTKAFDYHRRIAGMKPIELSPTFVYAQLNGGQDRGASVSACMQVLGQIGTCTRQECGVDQIFQNQIPRSAWTTAQGYKLQQAFVIRTFDELGSALTLFGPAAIGILIGQNFGRLDGQGVAPLPVVTVGGHAITAVGLKQIQGQWCPLIQNSWDVQFGFDGGFAYITERHTYRMFDGFALVIPKESGDIEKDDEPPHAKYQRILLRQYGLFQHPVAKETVVSVPEVPPPAAPLVHAKFVEDLKAAGVKVNAPVQDIVPDAPAETNVVNVTVQEVKQDVQPAATPPEEPFKAPSLKDILLGRASGDVTALAEASFKGTPENPTLPSNLKVVVEAVSPAVVAEAKEILGQPAETPLKEGLSELQPIESVITEMIKAEDKKALEAINNAPVQETPGDLVAQKTEAIQEFAEAKAAEQPPAPAPAQQEGQPSPKGQGGKKQKRKG